MPISTVHNNPKHIPAETFFFCDSSIVLSFSRQSSNNVIISITNEAAHPDTSVPAGQDLGR
jgi:hypothetical protein